MDTQFLTAFEIAKLLKISKALAYRLISQRKIPSIRFGKTVRVLSSDLQKFIEDSSSAGQVSGNNEFKLN
jgi:excisionase family DNA binding protein